MIFFQRKSRSNCVVSCEESTSGMEILILVRSIYYQKILTNNLEVVIIKTRTKKVVVQLGTAHGVMVGPSGTGPLSFHCREREVCAALWSQPHAMPSALGAAKPRPSPEPHGPTLGLERAGQSLATPDPAPQAEPMSTPLWSPHLGYRPSLLSPAIVTWLESAYKVLKCGVL